MHTELYADDAIDALAAARPLLVDVVPAREVVPHLAAGGACHAGPPIASADMCPPMRAALGVALALEGVAARPPPRSPSPTPARSRSCRTTTAAASAP